MNPPVGLIITDILLGMGVGVKFWVLVGKLVSVFNAGISVRVGEGIVGDNLFISVQLTFLNRLAAWHLFP